MALFRMKDMEENFLEVNADEPIYRIFSRERFLELVETQRNTLVKPRLWDDPFENFFLQCSVETLRGEPASLEPIRDKWYGQCWTTERDTDAMWRIYSHNKDGVRVKSTPKKIFSPLYSIRELHNDEATACFIGRVEYLESAKIEEFLEAAVVEQQLLNPKHTAKTLLTKRTEFRHEQEVRILFQDIHHNCTDVFVQYKFDFNETIDEVTIDPRARADEREMLERHLLSKNITAPVTKSTLYEFSPKKLKLSMDMA